MAGGGVEVGSSEIVACRYSQMVRIDGFQRVQCLPYGGSAGNVLCIVADKGSVKIVDGEDGYGHTVLLAGCTGENVGKKGKQEYKSAECHIRSFFMDAKLTNLFQADKVFPFPVRVVSFLFADG